MFRYRGFGSDDLDPMDHLFGNVFRPGRSAERRNIIRSDERHRDSRVVEISDADDLREFVRAADGLPMLIDFSSTSCPPSRAFVPTLDALSVQYDQKLAIGKINVDRVRRTDPLQQFIEDIDVVPTFIFFTMDLKRLVPLSGLKPVTGADESAVRRLINSGLALVDKTKKVNQARPSREPPKSQPNPQPKPPARDPPKRVYLEDELRRLRTSELKSIVAERGFSCDGPEKSDFVEAILASQPASSSSTGGNNASDGRREPTSPVTSRTTSQQPTPGSTAAAAKNPPGSPSMSGAVFALDGLPSHITTQTISSAIALYFGVEVRSVRESASSNSHYVTVSDPLALANVSEVPIHGHRATVQRAWDVEARQNKREVDRLEKQRLEKDRLQKEQLEKERLERLEQEQLVRLEQERLEQLEKAGLERLETERLERLEKKPLEKMSTSPVVALEPSLEIVVFIFRGTDTNDERHAIELPAPSTDQLPSFHLRILETLRSRGGCISDDEVKAIEFQHPDPTIQRVKYHYSDLRKYTVNNRVILRYTCRPLPPIPRGFYEFSGTSCQLSGWQDRGENCYRSNKIYGSDSNDHMELLTFFESHFDATRSGLHILDLYAIDNDTLVSAFRSCHNNLHRRLVRYPETWNKKDWDKDPDPNEAVELAQAIQNRKWRQAIEAQFKKRTAEFDHNFGQHAKILPVVHVTGESVAWQVCKTGFASQLADKAEPGFFGRGIYSTTYGRYAMEYADGSAEAFMLFCFAVVGNPYPVIEYSNGPNTLSGTAVQKGHDSHYVLVKNFQPAGLHELGMSDVYDEVVVFNEAQMLPRFVARVRFGAGPQKLWRIPAALTPVARLPNNTRIETEIPRLYCGYIDDDIEQEVLLNTDYLVLGREQLPCPATRFQLVSSVQFKFWWNQQTGTHYIQDCSTNGTWVQMPGSMAFTRLKKDVQVRLQDGALIALAADPSTPSDCAQIFLFAAHERHDGEVHSFRDRLPRRPAELPIHDVFGQRPVPQPQELLVGVQLREELSAGAFGVVYRGTYHGTNVALKTAKHGSCADMLRRECDKWESLRHPNIVFFYGVWKNGDQFYLCCELMHQDLRSLVSSQPLLERQRLRIARDIAAGMQHVESAGIVHGDLAARNVLCNTTPDGFHAKITDFGLSRSIASAAEVATHAVSWSAPEVLSMHPMSCKSDVWSAAVTMWEVWSAGAVPYGYIMDANYLAKRLREGKRLQAPESCSPEVVHLLHQCWAYNPADRPSFGDVWHKLDYILNADAPGYLPPGDAAYHVRLSY